MIKLFIDDTRPAPEGWHLETTIQGAHEFILEHAQDISHIDFDYYMSAYSTVPNCAELIQYLIYEKVPVFHQPRKNYTFHSSDSSMNDRMNTLIDVAFGLLPEPTIEPKVTASKLSMLRKSKGRR